MAGCRTRARKPTKRDRPADPRPASARIDLHEDFVRSKTPHVVDRDKGIIRGVKIIGLVSENGRRYTPESLRGAIGLYEGRVVNIDHPAKPGDSRAAEDRFGRLVNVQLREDGLYGDLEFLKTHPMAQRICEAAERMPEVFGLSHNAQGDGEEAKDGTFTVKQIIEVRSVDVVADPATTNGLFESKGKTMKRCTIKAFLEAAAKRLKAGRAKRLTRLLEDSGIVADDMEMDAPDGFTAGDDGAVAGGDDMEPEDHLKLGFQKACYAIIDDDSKPADQKIKELKELLKTHEKLKGSTAADDEPDESEEDDDVEEDKDDAKCDKGMESKSDREAIAKDLCELAQVKPEGVLLKTLTRCRTRRDMTETIKWAKAQATGAPEKKGQAPRSSANGTAVTEDKKIPQDATGRMNFLRSGR